MIEGRRGDTTGRPYVEGRLALPHHPDNPYALCSFIVDTGAESSVLVPIDARRMRLDRSKLQHPKTTLGIGGAATGFEEYAFIILKDEHHRKLYNFRIRVFIPDETPEMMEIDGSVLGRDVLDHVVLTYDGPARRVTLDVTDCEESFEA